MPSVPPSPLREQIARAIWEGVWQSFADDDPVGSWASSRNEGGAWAYRVADAVLVEAEREACGDASEHRAPETPADAVSTPTGAAAAARTAPIIDDRSWGPECLPAFRLGEKAGAAAERLRLHTQLGEPESVARLVERFEAWMALSDSSGQHRLRIESMTRAVEQWTAALLGVAATPQPEEHA